MRRENDGFPFSTKEKRKKVHFLSFRQKIKVSTWVVCFTRLKVLIGFKKMERGGS